MPTLRATYAESYADSMAGQRDGRRFSAEWKQRVSAFSISSQLQNLLLAVGFKRGGR